MKNGVPVYTISAGTQEVVKIELIFAAGNISTEKTLIATATNDLMDEGSLNFSSSEIAEALEIPLGTVKSRLHAAVGRLTEIWQATGPSQDH